MSRTSPMRLRRRATRTRCSSSCSRSFRWWSWWRCCFLSPERRDHPPAHRLRQHDLRRLPGRLRDEHGAVEPQTVVLHRSPRLAGPARFDPRPRGLQVHGPLAAGPAEPSGAHHATVHRREQEGARAASSPIAANTRPSSPSWPRSSCSPSRASSCSSSRARRRTRTSRRAAAHCGGASSRSLRSGTETVPGDAARPAHRRVGHVRRRGDHRSAREHPGEHPRASARRPSRSETMMLRPPGYCRTSSSRSRTSWRPCVCRWLRTAPIHLPRSH